MRTELSRQILNVHDFGAKNIRSGVIPFGSAKGYGLSRNQKETLSSAFTPSGDGELDAKRLTSIADGAKAAVVRLFEDVANFAKSPLERVNIIDFLNKGISFGRERGLQLVNNVASSKENRSRVETNRAFVNPLKVDAVHPNAAAALV